MRFLPLFLIEREEATNMGNNIQKDPLNLSALSALRNYVDEYSGFAASALNADIIPSFDTGPFREAVLQVSGSFIGTLTFQGSNDNVNFWPMAAVSVMSGLLVNVTTATGIFIIPLSVKYFRVRMTAYTSGIATGIVRLSTVPLSIDALVNTISVLANGTVAHDGVDTGNPVKIGGKARNADTLVVANGDRVDGYYDLLGKAVTVPLGVRALIVQNTITLTTATETTLLPAGGAGNFLDISWLVVTNTSAAAVRVDLRAGTASTVVLSIQAPAGLSTVVDLSDLPMIQSTANNNWTAQLSAGVTDVRVTASAIKRAA